MTSANDKMQEIAVRSGLATPPANILMALSGGVDSVSLLHWLTAIGHRPIVAHFNHRWYPCEDGFAAFCKKIAHAHSLQFVCGKSHGKIQRTETAAREERYAFLAETARAHNCDKVVVAHTACDQAETVLMRLIRGSGSHGLSAMKKAVSRGGVTLLRPWLELSRREVLAYARKHRLEWVEDPVNSETFRLRSRVRKRLIPYLKKHFHPDISSALCRTATVLSDEDSWLHELAVSQLSSVRDRSLPHRIVIPALASLPICQQRRVVKLWLESEAIADISWTDIESVLALCDLEHPPKINLAGNRFVRRREKRLFVEVQPTASRPSHRNQPAASSRKRQSPSGKKQAAQPDSSREQKRL